MWDLRSRRQHAIDLMAAHKQVTFRQTQKAKFVSVLYAVPTLLALAPTLCWGSNHGVEEAKTVRVLRREERSSESVDWQPAHAAQGGKPPSAPNEEHSSVENTEGPPSSAGGARKKTPRSNMKVKQSSEAEARGAHVLYPGASMASVPTRSCMSGEGLPAVSQYPSGVPGGNPVFGEPPVLMFICALFHILSQWGMCGPVLARGTPALFPQFSGKNKRLPKKRRAKSASLSVPAQTEEGKTLLERTGKSLLPVERESSPGGASANALSSKFSQTQGEERPRVQNRYDILAATQVADSDSEQRPKGEFSYAYIPQGYKLLYWGEKGSPLCVKTPEEPDSTTTTLPQMRHAHDRIVGGDCTTVPFTNDHFSMYPRTGYPDSHRYPPPGMLHSAVHPSSASNTAGAVPRFHAPHRLPYTPTPQAVATPDPAPSQRINRFLGVSPYAASAPLPVQIPAAYFPPPCAACGCTGKCAGALAALSPPAPVYHEATTSVPLDYPSGTTTSGPSDRTTTVFLHGTNFLPPHVTDSVPSYVTNSAPSHMMYSVPSHGTDSVWNFVPSHVPVSVPSHVPESVPSHVPDSAPSHGTDFVPSHETDSVPSHGMDSAPSHETDSVPPYEPDSVPSHEPDSAPSHETDSVPPYQPDSVPSHKPDPVPSHGTDFVLSDTTTSASSGEDVPRRTKKDDVLYPTGISALMR